MAIIDASVYVSLLNTHELSHVSSWEWFRKAQKAGEAFAAPSILLPEVAAALIRGVQDLKQVNKAIAQLKSEKPIELVPVTKKLAETAARIAAKQQIRGCDALYVALAIERQDTLVTLDKQQLQRASAIVTTRVP